MKILLPVLLTAAFVIFTPTLRAQNTGNTAWAGPYAAWELYDAQNPPARSFDGCLVRDDQNLWLVPHKGRPWLLNRLTASGLLGFVGAHLKIRGRENWGAGRHKDSTTYRFVGKEGHQHMIRTEVINDREINVDRFAVVSQSCPEKWAKGQ